jgi:hypothetical protein
LAAARNRPVAAFAGIPAFLYEHLFDGEGAWDRPDDTHRGVVRFIDDPAVASALCQALTP